MSSEVFTLEQLRTELEWVAEHERRTFEVTHTDAVTLLAALPASAVGADLYEPYDEESANDQLNELEMARTQRVLDEAAAISGEDPGDYDPQDEEMYRAIFDDMNH